MTALHFRAESTAAALELIPVLRAIKSVRDGELVVFVKEAAASLFAHEPGIRVVSHSQLARKAKDFPVYPLPTDSAVEQPPLVAQLTSALDLPLAELVSRQSPLPRLSDADREEASHKMGTKSGPWLGIAPFSRSEKRSPPLGRWEKLLAHITAEAKYERYFLFGRPSDFKRLHRLRLVAAEPDRVECVFPSSFRTMSAYFARLDGLVTIDSGALPLAKALSVRAMVWQPIGVFQRFPTALETVWAFDKWQGLAMLE